LSAPIAAEISVAVVGMGYVGLPTAIALGVAGHPVIGLDICEPRLDAIRAGAAELLDHEQALTPPQRRRDARAG
jgi:UDP-N-acetyl-D-glucosamine dehydrogenase